MLFREVEASNLFCSRETVKKDTVMYLFFAFVALGFAQVSILDLPVNVDVHGVAHLEQWVFYKFVVPPSSGFVLRVTHASKHDLDVYVAKSGGSLPRFISALLSLTNKPYSLFVQKHRLCS
jgi:hypothetical protein